jgi:hypothetical protein
VRQWVLTMPYRLHYLLAWDHRLSRAVLGVYARALLDLYRRRAEREGLPDGRTGTVTVIQRFGSGLNLNIHFRSSPGRASGRPRRRSTAARRRPTSSSVGGGAG